MDDVFSFFAGIGVGAAAMYALDPDLGTRRRALARDKLTETTKGHAQGGGDYGTGSGQSERRHSRRGSLPLHTHPPAVAFSGRSSQILKTNIRNLLASILLNFGVSHGDSINDFIGRN